MDNSKFQNIIYSKSYSKMLKQIYKKEGVFSLYRGTLFSMSMNMLLGLFFMINEKLKRTLNKTILLNDYPRFQMVISSSSLSFLFAMFYSPFFTIKTWLLLNTSEYKKRPSTLKIIRQISK